MVKIAIDTMGSDMGPEELVEGCKKFLDENEDVGLVLFGDESRIGSLISSDRVEIVNTTEVVPMEVSPMQFLRMKDSSMRQAIARAKEDDEVGGVVSAGSTGGFVTGCQLILKNIPGVIRSGLTGPFPTKKKGKKTVILDIGASNYNTGEELVCFAKLGYYYSKLVLGNENPSIYLLSNGTETGKGLKETIEADESLSKMGFPGYKGRCEAREVLDGEHDVVVTTGYPGNILLKSIEGTAKMMGSLLKGAFTKNIFTKIGYLMSKSGIKEMMKMMDSKELGGAMLLGVNKVAVKAHGNSNGYAFYNALKVAYKMISSGLVEAIGREFKDEGQA